MKKATVVSANPNNPNAGLNVAEMAKTLDEKVKAHESALGGHEALQALLAFSALHEQIRQKRALGNSATGSSEDTWKLEQFVLDEVLHMVAERAQIITGADGVAIALADRDAIVCRASVGMIVPDPGVRLDTNSGFSGVCFRSAEVVRCDDSESDQRVDIRNCRHLGARSMVAVPLLAKSNVIGLLEVFSTDAYAFNDGDVRGLKLLAELILAAMKPEEEDRLAEISRNVVAEGSAPSKNSAVEKVSTEAHIPESLPLDLPVEDSSALNASAVKSDSNNELEGGEQSLEKIRLLAANTNASEPVEQLWPRSESPIDNGHTELDLLRSYVSTENDQPSNSKPGLLVILLLVIVAAVIGGYVWWSMQHRSRLSASTAVNPKMPAATTATSAAPSTLQESSQELNAEDSDLTAPAPLTTPPNLPHGALPAVTGIRHWSSPNSSTVVVDLQDQVQYEAHRLTNPDRIYFDLHDTSLAPALMGQTIKIGDAFLQRVRVAQPVKGITRVVLETTATTSSFSVSMEENPCRLVVEVGKGNTKLQNDTSSDLPGMIQVPSTAPSHQQSSLQSGVAPTLRIVVDPGHGGWDLGTVGRNGLLEKDLVLDIAERLSSMLQKDLNANVILTRTDNTYISLERRAEIANLAKADLFVSIHANYSSSSSARGVETYYTDTYSSIHARTPETSAAAPAGSTPDWTNVDIRKKVQESRQLAESVQHTLYGMLSEKSPGLENRGTKDATYAVLTGTTMPAILAEVSFVSSPTDEAKLKQEAYRERIARALYDGISHYVVASHKVKIAGIPSSRRVQ